MIDNCEFLNNLAEKLRNIQMKNIALHSVHEKLNAKMVPFAGYNMPV